MLLIAFGVRQGCVIAPDAFATGMDWLLERSVARGMNDITFGQCEFTDPWTLQIPSGLAAGASRFCFSEFQEEAIHHLV